MKYLMLAFIISTTVISLPLSAEENCEVATEPALDAFGNFVNDCYDGSVDHQFNPTSTLNSNVHHNKFRQQSSTCRCLLSRQGSDGKFENKTDILAQKDYVLTHLKSSAEKFIEQSQFATNMAVLQAGMTSPETAKNYNLHKTFDVAPEYKEFVNDAISQSVGESTTNGSGLPNDVQKVFNSAIAEKRTAPITNILTKEKIAGETCFPMSIYLFTKTFPRNPIFYKSFPRSFNKDQWEVAKLKNRFKFGKVQGAEREYIKGQIEFLEKNPILKMVFSSNNKSMQEKAFNLLKNNVSPFSCNEQNMKETCEDQFAAKHLRQFREDMNVFMNEQEVMQIVADERKQEFATLLDELVLDTKNKTEISTMNKYAKDNLGADMKECENNSAKGIPFLASDVSQIKSVHMNKKMSNKPQSLIDTRLFEVTDNLDGQTACLDKMVQYCRMMDFENNSQLKMAAFDINVANSQELDDLYQEIRTQMNPDPATHRDYQQTINNCNNNRRIFNGKSVDFDTFKSMICPADTETCNDKTALFLKYAYLAEEKSSQIQGVANIPNLGKFRVANLDAVDREKFSSANSSFENVFSDAKTNVSLKNEIAKSSSFNSEVGKLTEEDQKINTPTTNTLSFPSIQSSDYMYALNSARETKKEIDEEIKVTKESLDYNRERLARENSTPEFREEVSDRVKLLQDLLAQKEKSSQEYQNIIAKLLDKKDDDSQAMSKSPRLASQALTEVRNETAREIVKSQTPKFNNLSRSEGGDESSRSPASVTESFSTSGGSRGGAAVINPTSFDSSSMASRGRSGTGKINTALLSKYGITVQDNDLGIQVATDKERSQVSNLLINASKSDLGVEVSKVDYEKFKNNDISALNKLYEEKIEMLETDVVKLMIRSQGEEESLEFYAIKEDGKVVFQPVRKSRLSDLQNVLHQ